MADAFLTMPIFGRVRFGDWDGILNMPQPKDTMRSTTLIWRFARALAFAARGDRAAAEREQQAFEARRKALPADASWVNNKASDIMALASEIISARLAAAPAEAVPHWRRAVAIQDALVYDEPPGWFYPGPGIAGCRPDPRRKARGGGDRPSRRRQPFAAKRPHAVRIDGEPAGSR